jgi:NTE family protein/lysophospholipid hydrolase
MTQALKSVGGSALLVDGSTLDAALGTPLTAIADDSGARARVASWLHEQEAKFQFIVFECGALPRSWTDFCLRQSDVLMFVAAPDAPAATGALDRRIFTGDVVTPSVTKVLVLLHAADTSQPRGAAAWLQSYPVTRHHHVRVNRDGDYARVARFIAGRAVGLALSGGGARTLAHVGVVQALGERGIPIDYVAGVSAGVFTAAYLALGNDADAVFRLCQENMGNYNMLADATLPMVAFLSGKNLVKAVRSMYGDVDIEDLWLPFFCLSANLTTARVVVHDRGPLWLGIRATISVPGVEPPVCINGELLVDGGVMNNLPVDVMRTRCNGTVIASDVSLTADISASVQDLSEVSGWPLLWRRVSPFNKPSSRIPHIFEILTRTATVGSTYHGRSMVPMADLYIRTPTDGVPLFDWKAGTAIVPRARELALEAIDRWRVEERASRG